MKKIIYISFIILLFIFPIKSYGSTQIEKNITTDTVWDKVHSPYQINTSVVIATGVTLTINPGVTVTLNNSTLSILGSLKAQGTNKEKIYFNELNDKNQSGIEFVNSTSSLSTVELTNLDKGIQLINSQVIFSDVNYNDSTSGIEVFNNSSLYCTKCVFSNTANSLNSFALAVYNNSNAFVTSSLFNIVSNAIGVYDTTGESVSHLTITDSTIKDMSRNGIVAYGKSAIVGQNIIIQNAVGKGIDGYGEAQINISSSTIEHNAIGINIFQSAVGSIASSIIRDNTYNGITSSTQEVFNAQDNWWGTTTGPYHDQLNKAGGGNAVSGNVIFEPWIGTIQSDKKCCSNVLFIPGFQASRLYMPGIVAENQLWEPNRNADVQKLYLDTNGKSTNPISTRDVIYRTNYPAFNVDIYSQFSLMLDDLVQQHVIQRWASYPYDWRFDVRDIIKTKEVIYKLKEIARTSTTGKVTIVTHSNGGLMIKALLQELHQNQDEGLIDKVIMVATPHYGTPQSVAALVHGDNQSLGFGLLLNKQTARTFGSTMPGAYNLLPSLPYFNSTIPVITFDSSLKKSSINLIKNGSEIRSFTNLKDFLLGTKDGRNTPSSADLDNPSILNKNLIQNAESLHTSIDSYVFPSYIDAYNIIGTGIPTINQISYTLGSHCILSSCIDHRPQFTQQGDGTVTNQSSVVNTYGVKNIIFNLYDYNQRNNTNITHATILESKTILNYIKTLLSTNEKADSSKVSVEVRAISNAQEILQHDYVSIGVHSPVSIDLYDQNNNHTGLVQSNNDISFIQQDIPNSYYIPFGEGQYAGFQDISTNILLAGTGNGTFTIDITASQNGSITKSTFEDIPILSTTESQIKIDPETKLPILSIDYDGDGIIDSTTTTSSDSLTKKYLDRLIILIQSSTIKDTKKQELIKKINKLIVILDKDKTKKMDKVLRSILKQLSHKFIHTKHLDSQGQDKVSQFIGQLPDSL